MFRMCIAFKRTCTITFPPLSGKALIRKVGLFMNACVTTDLVTFAFNASAFPLKGAQIR